MIVGITCCWATSHSSTDELQLKYLQLLKERRNKVAASAAVARGAQEAQGVQGVQGGQEGQGAVPSQGASSAALPAGGGVGEGAVADAEPVALGAEDAGEAAAALPAAHGAGGAGGTAAVVSAPQGQRAVSDIPMAQLQLPVSATVLDPLNVLSKEHQQQLRKNR